MPERNVEHYLPIKSQQATLAAILHEANGDTGVLLLVGGPQYRVGSHRQFVKLARQLASHNIPTLRLDSQGMGDASGGKTEFYQLDADIALALDQFFKQCPALKRVVLWGLCDAASASMLYLNKQDPRLAAAILLNPWVRQQQSHAQTMLKHYYWQRLFSAAFWRKLLGGGVHWSASIKALLGTVKTSRQHRHSGNKPQQQTPDAENYVQLMLQGGQRFNGKLLVITSGNDITAQEFLDLCQQDANWQQLLQTAEHLHIAGANHTFASADWRGQVEQTCCNFIQRHFYSTLD